MALPPGGTIGSRVELIKLLVKGTVGAEIGVLKGRFARRVVEHVKPSIYYLVDVWERIEGSHYKQDRISRALRIVLHDLRPWIQEGRVRLLCGRSTEVVNLIPPGHLDWVYIDGDHTYEGVLADLRGWTARVKRGGYVMGHDYVGAEHCGDRGASHVKRAVEQFGREHDLGSIGVTIQHPATFWFRKDWA